MTFTSSETEVYTTPPTSPSQLETCNFPGHLLRKSSSLDLNFDENYFSLLSKARGICCSAKNVWYSNCHWPEQPQYKHLFDKAAETWEKLAPEFTRIWNGVWKKSLVTTPWTVELRLAGARQVGEQEVGMRSTVWIRSTDEAIRSNTVWKRLQKEVRRLGLNSVQYAPIFAEGGLRSANDTTSIPLERLPLSGGVQFSDRATLYTHVGLWSTDGSYGCGQVCLATIIAGDKIVYQQIARIGGVLSVNSVYMAGVTSGHTMLLYFLQKSKQFSLIWQDDSNIPTGSGIPVVTSESLYLSEDLQVLELDSDSDHDDEDSDNECDLVENNNSDSGVIDDLGYLDLERVKAWVPLTLSDTINFISQAEINLSSVPPFGKLTNPSTCPIPTDFALLSVAESGFSLTLDHNVYHPKEPKHVSGICTDACLSASEHEILVLLGNGKEPSPGFILPTKIPFCIGNTTIWTRKIRLDAPLGRGTSGSWVVSHHSGALCGSIVAVFEQEPCALMMTAQALLSDIIKYSRNIVLVTLGTHDSGSVPEEHLFVLNNLHQEVGMRSTNKERISHSETPFGTIKQQPTDTLTSMANFVSTYTKQGHWKEAEKLLVDIIAIGERVQGEEHPDTLAATANLALVYMKQGRWKKAEELQVGLMVIRKRALGEEHPDTLTTMANLALTYTHQGRWKEAEEFDVVVMAIRKRVQGRDHPDTLTSMANLALTYTKQGRWKEAEELQVDVLETSKRVLGEEHPNTLASMANLAVILKANGRIGDALFKY